MLMEPRWPILSFLTRHRNKDGMRIETYTFDVNLSKTSNEPGCGPCGAWFAVSVSMSIQTGVGV